MKIKVGDKIFEVEIFEREDKIIISVNKKEFCFEEREKKHFEVKIPKKEFGEISVLAPIGGEIIKIFKKEGEEIKKGEKILTIAAMKMENEIESEYEGKILKILKKEGEIVKKGDILFIIKCL